MALNPFSDAVGDIFGAIGDFKEAGAYGKSATLDAENAEIARQSTAIQESQANRQIYQATGAITAAAGANNLTTGGSAGDIFRSSVAQGALQKQLIGRQGIINENSFLAEQQAALGMQSASNAKGIASLVSAPLSFFGL